MRATRHVDNDPLSHKIRLDPDYERISGKPREVEYWCWRRRTYIRAILIDIGVSDGVGASNPNAAMTPEYTPCPQRPERATRSYTTQRGNKTMDKITKYLHTHGPSLARDIARGVGITRMGVHSALKRYPDCFVLLSVRATQFTWGLREDNHTQ